VDANAVRLEDAPPAASPPSSLALVVTQASATVRTDKANEAEEREELSDAVDRNVALSGEPKDPAVEEQRAKMLAELDELLKLGRDGVVRKIESDRRDER